MKKRFLALLLCTALVLALAGCSGTSSQAGDVTFTLKVVHGDGSEMETEVTTDKATVGEALADQGYISGEEGAYGLYVKTVDGETVDDAKEQWWCLTKNGESVNTGVDSTDVEAGASYEFTFTEGY